MSRRLLIAELGRRPYADVLELQRALCRERMAGERQDDVLLLVEHEPVVTLGRGTRPSSLPIPAPVLAERGVPVVEVERGGDVTYHGPGAARRLPGAAAPGASRGPALVPPAARGGGHRRRSRQAGRSAERNPGLTGVWTRGRKIASIGIHVKQWVTFHGFALNVSTDLSGFDLIVPCGIDGVVMTSVAAELGRADAPALWTAVSLPS